MPLSETQVGHLQREGYEIQRKISEGGQGEVYKAVFKPTEELVALKVIHRNKIKNRTDLFSIQQEVCILRQVSHPHVVKLVDAFTNSEGAYIALEFLGGLDLFEVMKAGSVFNERKALGIMRQILDALAHLHALGISHCDIKLENVVFTDRTRLDHVKLIDFGISHYKKPDYENDPDTANLGGMGSGGVKILGASKEYLAPELSRSHADILPQPVDMWCAGILFFVLIGRRYPFPRENKTKEEYQKYLQTARLEFAGPQFEGISPGTKTSIAHLLHKDPTKRPTAAEARLQVETLLARVASCKSLGTLNMSSGNLSSYNTGGSGNIKSASSGNLKSLADSATGSKNNTSTNNVNDIRHSSANLGYTRSGKIPYSSSSSNFASFKGADLTRKLLSRFDSTASGKDEPGSGAASPSGRMNHVAAAATSPRFSSRLSGILKRSGVLNNTEDHDTSKNANAQAHSGGGAAEDADGSAPVQTERRTSIRYSLASPSARAALASGGASGGIPASRSSSRQRRKLSSLDTRMQADTDRGANTQPRQSKASAGISSLRASFRTSFQKIALKPESNTPIARSSTPSNIPLPAEAQHDDAISIAYSDSASSLLPPHSNGTLSLNDESGSLERDARVTSRKPSKIKRFLSKAFGRA